MGSPSTSLPDGYFNGFLGFDAEILFGVPFSKRRHLITDCRFVFTINLALDNESLMNRKQKLPSVGDQENLEEVAQTVHGHCHSAHRRQPNTGAGNLDGIQNQILGIFINIILHNYRLQF